jgi:hypothetical protein
VNLATVIEMHNSHDWSTVHHMCSFEDSFYYFYSTYTNYFDFCFLNIHIKHKNFSLTSSRKHWVTDEIHGLSSFLKDMALYYQNKVDPVDRFQYDLMKKNCTQILQNTKRTFNNQRIYKAGNKTKEIWKIIKESKYPKCLTSDLNLVDPLGNILVEYPQMASALNDFFLSQEAPNLINRNKHSQTISTCNSLFLQSCSETELTHIIHKLDNKFTTGLDGIPFIIIKKSFHTVKLPLLYLIN